MLKVTVWIKVLGKLASVEQRHMGVYKSDMECEYNALQRFRADFHTVRVVL